MESRKSYGWGYVGGGYEAVIVWTDQYAQELYEIHKDSPKEFVDKYWNCCVCSGETPAKAEKAAKRFLKEVSANGRTGIIKEVRKSTRRFEY